MRHTAFVAAVGVLVGTGVPGAEAQEAPASTAVTWDAEGLSHLPKMLAKAAQTKRRLLIGLSGSSG